MNTIKKIIGATAVLFLFSSLLFAQDTTLTVTPNGFIGIGTSTPTEKLTLANGKLQLQYDQLPVDLSAMWFDESVRIMATDAQMALYSNASGSQSGAFILKELNADGQLNNQWSITRNTGVSALDFRFGSNANFGADPSLLTLHSSGQLGLGTRLPQATMHVANTNDGSLTQLELQQTVAGQFTRLRFRNPSSQTWVIAQSPEDDFRIWSGSSGKDVLTLTSGGNIGMGTTNPMYPLVMQSGAHVTDGGVWTNASSRDYKENISTLSSEEAISALAQLNPVKYNYKVEKDEEYVGFIAEDVPGLVATKDRKSLSSMDIVAVLTKVVQEQQKKIAELEALIHAKQ